MFDEECQDDEGGRRAMVATVGVNLSGSSPPLSDDTNFNLRCPPDEARERVERLADLGFDDLLLASGTNFAAEDVPEEALRQIIALKPPAEFVPSGPGAAPTREERPRAKDPVCMRFIDLTTMTSPTSRQVFTVEHAGQTYYLCSTGCKEAFEKDPAAYAR